MDTGTVARVRSGCNLRCRYHSGAGELLAQRRLILPSIGWAVLTILLQVGDLATASQYHMTVQSFAAYLFGLPAFDGLLIIQGLIIFLGLATRSYSKMLAKKKRLTYFEMGLSTSRRDFLQIGGTIGGLLAIAAVLGIWTAISSPEASTLPPSGNRTNTSTISNLPGRRGS